ncbi:MAG: nicotinic acid mononucleotide adenylyltransferase [Rhodobacteraceae bacterium]|nr:nicotinic acid mononucleotide adenylyltransferase [Paracoccaceae bacterium]MBR26926.1 nicotinic acid mononucleotide adenylyltransferase [Paracoccaceae bacterium]
MFQGFPRAVPGLRVGLLGGSFDPPHPGHVHITRQALARFRLDRVWWLVSPGNPLKARGPADLALRMEACRAVMRHPRVEITDIEARLGARYTARTLRSLRARYPGVRFVWLMGADNLAAFHRWDRWAEIARTTPIGVLGRPGAQLRAGLSPMARRFASARLPAGSEGALALRQAPAWAMAGGAMSDHSSTRIRAAGRWPTRGDPAD